MEQVLEGLVNKNSFSSFQEPRLISKLSILHDPLNTHDAYSVVAMLCEILFGNSIDVIDKINESDILDVDLSHFDEV